MKSYDVIVIGAGPGGYVAAIRAAQLGLKVGLVEKDETLGGTCLNVGCIPSKALLESSELYHAAKHRLGEHGIGVGEVSFDLSRMMERKAAIVRELTDGVAMLMKKNKVVVHRGQARLKAPERVALSRSDGTEEELDAQAVILATGSVPVGLASLPFDGEHVISSTEALALSEVPRHLIVVGAGAIGLELGSVWARLGAQVTVVELMDQVVPQADGQVAKLMARILKKQGLTLMLEAKVLSGGVKAAQTGSGKGKAQKASAATASVELEVEEKGGKKVTLSGDKVLVAVGRKPYTEGLGLEQVGVALDGRGRVRVDEHFATSVRGIYAIGDLIPGPMLAHKASEEGSAVAEIIAGKAGHVNYEAVPSVVYTWPELASVGLSEEQAQAKGLPFKTGKYFFKANGRAKSLGEEEGLVKIIAHGETDRLLGVHILGPRASEMIAEIAIAFEFGASAEDLARSMHAHPTLAEIIKEAALAVDKRAIHG